MPVAWSLDNGRVYELSLLFPAPIESYPSEQVNRERLSVEHTRAKQI